MAKKKQKYNSTHRNDENYDFEEWEGHCYYRDKNDYQCLVQYCKGIAQKRPNDLYARYYLAEAFILNKEYQTALVLLKEIYIKNPDIDDFQHLILDALYGLGKNESDFDWIKKPNILSLNKNIIDRCYNYLKPKRKPCNIEELYFLFILEGYLKFNEDDLFAEIKKDNRFLILDHGIFEKITINRKRE